MCNTQGLSSIMKAARIYMVIAIIGTLAAIVLLLNRSVEMDGVALALLLLSTALVVFAMLIMDDE